MGDGDQSNIISPSTSASDCWVNPQGLDPCYEPSGLAKARIYNATRNVIPAQHNRWGTCDQWSPLVDCFCEGDLFPPNQALVDFSNRNPQQLSACSEFLDPPGFFLGAAAPAAAPEGAWPNPFNGQIHFRYRARGEAAILEIFDILGRSVRHLPGIPLESGDREFIWEGDTDEGTPVSSGVYLYRVAGQGHLLKGKVIYVK